MRHTIYLALGSNLGNRTDNLAAALAALPPLVQVLHASPVYETPPWGYTDQPPFLNQVIQAETELSPGRLLNFLKQIEADMGRRVTRRNGPRPIDLDILFYDDLVLESPGLSIPHPRLRGRGFVLLPLADLAPNLIHPILKKSVIELLNEADITGIHPFL